MISLIVALCALLKTSETDATALPPPTSGLSVTNLEESPLFSFVSRGDWTPITQIVATKDRFDALENLKEAAAAKKFTVPEVDPTKKWHLPLGFIDEQPHTCLNAWNAKQRAEGASFKDARYISVDLEDESKTPSDEEAKSSPDDLTKPGVMCWELENPTAIKIIVPGFASKLPAFTDRVTIWQKAGYSIYALPSRFVSLTQTTNFPDNNIYRSDLIQRIVYLFKNVEAFSKLPVDLMALSTGCVFTMEVLTIFAKLECHHIFRRVMLDAGPKDLQVVIDIVAKMLGCSPDPNRYIEAVPESPGLLARGLHTVLGGSLAFIRHTPRLNLAAPMAILTLYRHQLLDYLQLCKQNGERDMEQAWKDFIGATKDDSRPLPFLEIENVHDKIVTELHRGSSECARDICSPRQLNALRKLKVCASHTQSSYFPVSVQMDKAFAHAIATNSDIIVEREGGVVPTENPRLCTQHPLLPYFTEYAD